MPDRKAGRPRGQPMVALVVILAGWIAMRAVLWESPFAPLKELTDVLGVPAPRAPVILQPPLSNPVRAVPAVPRLIERIPPPLLRWPMPPQRPLLDAGARADPLTPVAPPASTSHTIPSGAAHELLLLAAIGLDYPGAPRPAVERRAANRSVDRWSMDAWAFVRRGASNIGIGGLGPSYGGSQAGGIVRYRLDPGRASTAAYLRASGALSGPDQRELAFGLAARLLPDVPVQMMAEARVQRGSGRNTVVPAAAVVSALAPIALPQRLQAEVYAAAGYVGGPNATAFFDLQGVVDHALVSRPGLGLRLGGGLWAGGQEGAQRADIGPRMSISSAGRGANVRLAADYRFRVAGNAQPGSGPALTISASF